MRKPRVSAVLLVILALVLALPAVAGEAKAPKPIAEMSVSPARIDWLPAVEYEHLVLTVAGPENLYISQELKAGQALSLSLFDPEGKRLPDGSYVWELRVIPRRDPGTKLGETTPPRRPLVQSGNFFIKDGSFVAVEPLKRSTGPRSDSPVRNATAKDSIETGNLIVQKNACIGESCGTSDADVSVLKLKAPEIGILFDDVETVSELVGSSRNWGLVANPSGADQFSLFDMDNIQALFTVAGDAPENSLYIASNGNVGLGTSTPAASMHIYGSATDDDWIGVGPSPGSGPAMNIGYGGSTFGRGAGFLNVKPDASATAPNPSLRFLTANVERMIITNTGNVGIGTSSPSVPLHVNRSTGATLEGIRLSNNNEARITLENTGRSTQYFMAVNNTNPALFFIARSTDVGTIFEVNRRLDAGGVPSVNVYGSVQATNVTFTSSRRSKKDFKALEPQDVLARVAKLPISEWSFKEGPEQVRHIGPMAEDFHEAFGLSPDAGTISVTDTSGVALAAIQGLLQRIEELEKRNTELMDRLHVLENAPSQNVP